MAGFSNTGGSCGISSDLRKEAAGQFDVLLENLRKVRKRPEKMIHETRKELKKLRGFIRLIRGVMGESVYQKEDGVFRDAARKLSPFRDASVRVGLVESLIGDSEGSFSAAALRPALERVRDLQRKTIKPKKLRRAAEDARRLLKKARRRSRKWIRPRKADGIALLEEFERLRREARSALAVCLVHPTAVNFHEWRKDCKYLRHQIKVLDHLWPGLESSGLALEELGEILGDHHDLEVLGETLEPLAESGMAFEELDAIRRIIGDRQRDLTDRCLDLGRRIFTDGGGS